jgi:hypothetical protein
MMIATTLVEEVRRLLGEGCLSQRQIARRLGVSRGTVNAIALGKRRSDSNSRCGCEGADFTPPTGLPKRCPGCGGLTQMPCLACYIRAKKDARPTMKSAVCRGPTRESNAIASCG